MNTRTPAPPDTTAHDWCMTRPRHLRCRAAGCRWPCPPDTPLHAQTARMTFYSLVTLGVWLPIWLGLFIRHRHGKTGMWIYLGAWTIAAIAGQFMDPSPTTTPAPAPAVVVTVTVPAPVDNPPSEDNP